MNVVKTEDAPKAIGPYSQAVSHNDLLFLSGQIPINPKTGNVEATTIEAQTEQVMKNLGAVLKAGGSDFSKVLRCTVFLADMNDFAAFNKVYGTYFGDVPPSRSTVQVARLPRDVKIEVDAIASIR
ncbi:MAG: RidA family protein [Nitrososphaerota archaeon]|jgi:2-iminobutanoate/2-iminopropanoate deaminase|nr:RidA family protein [Nitrososphaerota archaeon]